MVAEQLMSFTNENGEKVDYVILEQKLICGKEYVAMAPTSSRDDIQIYKINFDKNWNESLSYVDSPNEINMFKQVSSLNF